MKILGLLLISALLAAGCATYHHSEYIDTDQQGFAIGRYSNNSSGRSGSFALAGAGGGVGSGGAGGLGFGAIAVNSTPPPVTPYSFARSVAMINYSKKLKSIKYDEFGGIVEYEFDNQPQYKRSSFQPTLGKSNLPKSFGHQPIE